MTEQTLIRLGDQPAGLHIGRISAERVLAELIAAGERFGCWVLRTPAGDRWPGDLWPEAPDAHFDSEADAAAGLAEILACREPGTTGPVVRIEQQPHPCGGLTCSNCGAPLPGQGPDLDVHHRRRSDLENEATRQCWTTDGRVWNCAGCPGLIILGGERCE